MFKFLPILLAVCAVALALPVKDADSNKERRSPAATAVYPGYGYTGNYDLYGRGYDQFAGYGNGLGYVNSWPAVSSVYQRGYAGYVPGYTGYPAGYNNFYNNYGYYGHY